MTETQPNAAGTKPLDSRLRGNDGNCTGRPHFVIPAKAGIQDSRINLLHCAPDTVDRGTPYTLFAFSFTSSMSPTM